ncbi:CLUMA_CG010971, isoform A [Clunio marinus]|uniref:CLUMA_CG010971, isoform A n=1 Tax=Clunio marinus TaxID=568069 RepID=A0A1J1IGL2_9DIPT|nr:CLUMA_CG010971, isoform A [Clunio marinus]
MKQELRTKPSKHDVMVGSPNYVHKIHGASKLEGKNEADGCPMPGKTNELWSVAKLSLECNNNHSKDDSRTSFYQQLNQIHQRNFHHLDMTNSSAHL